MKRIRRIKRRREKKMKKGILEEMKIKEEGKMKEDV